MTAAPADPARQFRPDGLRSSISCRRSGKRSITALISRTSRGEGRRCLTSPSLSMIASMKPRARSRWRSELPEARSVSMITTTSRSYNCSARASMSRICCMKAGSFGVSASTATTRHSHRNSSMSASTASKMRNPSISTSASGASSSTSVAARAWIGKRTSRTARRVGMIRKFLTVSVVSVAVGVCDIGACGRKTLDLKDDNTASRWRGTTGARIEA